MLLQVIQVQNTLKALEILEVFLDMIKTRTEYLAKQKQIPEEMRASVMSIAYAASRMPDIPEMAAIRKHLEARFGREAFAELVAEDPSPAGVQERLIKYLTVDPPQATVKVDVAMKVIEQRSLSCTREELNEARCRTACHSFAILPPLRHLAQMHVCWSRVQEEWRLHNIVTFISPPHANTFCMISSYPM